ncbi:glycosyltransferase family 2 protein [Acetobacteraceae bacterium ESL0709]|nr:glycosyltransferase family 2 protein [Acetobacteraceae bacterium ESL0697]MDF7677312.1 glycosyltransferase family 2 protein [Acetobacteraceae bacterium ESL0709]
MKVALVGIVRNERKDILPWLGWHAKLGIDTFVLFDDHSDDGTDLLLKTASLHLDIRLFRIENVANAFPDRKRIVYLDALNGLKDSFDWVGFLDSDEYLNLYRHDDIHDFLAHYAPPVNAVALHRCTYGSNQEILHPDYPDFHAFTRHGPAGHPLNRWIKSFIRPAFFNKQWENSHYFPLSEGRYVTAEGDDIEWEQPGQTRTPAQWQTANILYYPGGSMEELVARALRGHPASLSTGELYSEELNSIQDSRPQGRTVALLQWMRPLITEAATLALLALEPLFPPLSDKTLKDKKVQAEFKIARLLPWNMQKLEVQAGFACLQERPQGQSEIFLLYDQSLLPAPSLIFALDSHNNPINFLIRADSRLSGFLPYQRLPAPETGAICLQKQGGLSQRRTFLTAVPHEPLIADRPVPAAWENFDTVPCTRSPNNRKWDDLPFVRLVRDFLSGPRTIRSILSLVHKDHVLTIRLLPFFMEYLSPEEKRIVQSQLSAVQPYLF